MSKIILIKYNNYFNKIKKINSAITFSEWLIVNSDINNYEIINMNFYFNDGVNTSIVVNQQNDLFIYDYLLVCEPEKQGEIEQLYIKSSWFIMEHIRNTKGQYRLTLKRDLINDFYSKISEAPIFVEKGIVGEEDPYIFNSEGIIVNQIKQREILLKDKTKTGWLVGYVARAQAGEENKTITSNTDIDYKWTSETYPYKTEYTNKRFSINTDNNIQLIIPTEYARYSEIKPITTKVDLISKEVYSYYDKNNYFSSTGDKPYYINNRPLATAPVNFLQNAINDYVDEVIEKYTTSEILETNGDIIYDTTTLKYYKIKISLEGTGKIKEAHYPTSNYGLLLKNIIEEAVMFQNNEFPNSAQLREAGTGPIAWSYYNSDNYVIELEEIIEGKQSVVISAGRNKLIDAPYDMFAIPYGELEIIGDTSWKTNLTSALNIAQAIAEQGATWLYDLQLLPYFPIQQLLNLENKINLTGLVEGQDYNIVGTENSKNTILFWAKISNFSVNIPYNYMVKNTKLEDICDIWRLSSPNYQGIFEFSMAKNGGCSYIEADCTYKPYNPYIKLNPNFSRLYGQDFNDARGLICGGNFSVATTTDAFKNYEINNKNYQNIFDRQISNLEVKRKYEVIQQIPQALAGTGQGVALGGVAGGVAGAVAGGIASGLGGIADMMISRELYRENKSYQTDLYNFNLQNIQARPDSLTKAGAFTLNNKIFPFIEYYSCTEEEKEAIEKKIKYNGMTIGRIDTLINFINQGDPQFFQGQIIRIDDLGEDYHIAIEIFNELKKGVYI